MSGNSNIYSKEGSSSRYPLCWETPQGATELNPDLTETRVTPTYWEEHLLTSIESSGNLEMLKERIGTLNVQNKKKICSGAARKKQGRPDWQRFQLGTLTGCNLNRDPLNWGSIFNAGHRRNEKFCAAYAETNQLNWDGDDEKD